MRASDVSGPIAVQNGQADVACGLLVRVTCPVCGGLHEWWVEVGDHPELPGDHLWLVTCQGQRFVTRIARASFAAARLRAEAYASRNELRLGWNPQGAQGA